MMLYVINMLVTSFLLKNDHSKPLIGRPRKVNAQTFQKRLHFQMNDLVSGYIFVPFLQINYKCHGYGSCWEEYSVGYKLPTCLVLYL